LINNYSRYFRANNTPFGCKTYTFWAYGFALAIARKYWFLVPSSAAVAIAEEPEVNETL